MKWGFAFALTLVGLVWATGDPSQSAGTSFFPGQTTLVHRKALWDSVKAQWQSQQEEQGHQSAKSIPRAVVFSALVPGSGQFYARSYIKAALFFAVEAVAWYVNIRYNKRGDDKDAEFRAFADRYWSEHRYWSYVYYRLVNANPPPDLETFTTYTVPGKDWVLIAESEYDRARQELRRYEDSQYIPGFTHHLPETKTQQYYEMIGKYPEQFGNAWEDASFQAYYNGYLHRITPLNEQYRKMRDESNHLYEIASYGAMVALVNHVISALDAGFTARRFNRRHLRMTYKSFDYPTEYVNMFGVEFEF